MQAIIHTDVLVLGGGSAGVSAAVAAANAGLKVIVVERNSFFGGKATAAEVGTVCGLYRFSKNGASEYIVNGFARQFAEKLRINSKTTPLHNNSGLHYLPYDISAFKKICNTMLEHENIRVYNGTFLYKVELNNDLIESVVINTAQNDVQVMLKAMVDASGESNVSQLTGLPVIKSDKYQAAAQVFTLKNINEDSEYHLGMILMKELRSAIDKGTLEHYYDRVYIVQGSLRNNRVSLKLGLPLPVTHTPENLDALNKMAHSFVENLTAYLTTHVAAFKNACIENIAPEVGIRVGLRTTGKYILTEEDVLGCKKFDDAVANASWPIEVWEQNKRVNIRYFALEDFYQVPAGCLQSDKVSNLFIAGRNISATDSAIASARVMGICLQTGYAAGCLAAGNVQQVPVAETVKNIQSYQL
jgi:hypothetical protein